MPRQPVIALTVCAVFVLAAPPISAQTGLAATKALRCSFQRQSTGAWTTGGAASPALRQASLTLRFEAINTDTGTANLRNGAMVSEVTVRSVPGYLHFMQAFRTGPLYTTTIFEAGASGRKYKAVHSRHEYFSTPLPGATSSPEQYYGECEVG